MSFHLGGVVALCLILPTIVGTPATAQSAQEQYEQCSERVAGQFQKEEPNSQITSRLFYAFGLTPDWKKPACSDTTSWQCALSACSCVSRNFWRFGKLRQERDLADSLRILYQGCFEGVIK